MNHCADTPKDRAAAANMARRLRTMYCPRERLVVLMAVDYYLRRMRAVRAGRPAPVHTLFIDSELTMPEQKFNLRDRTRRVIRADGRVEPLERPHTMRELEKLLNTDTVDTVNLRHMGHPLMVMVVIDRGWDTVEVEGTTELHGMKFETTTLQPVAPKFPINEEATALYLANCVPGTTHQIAGDVAIVPDTDFE